MTKEQYFSFGNEQFLTDDEKAEEKEKNVKTHYGLSEKQLAALVKKHKSARKKADYRTMAKIEYRLTDINFHWACSKMHRGEYKEVLDEIKEVFADGEI